ncbi:MAG TPA: helix-turn-helix domain-containing protein [Dehalococcoidia bacterium]|nr:helix-turn-helix domain-containing protein [Dehalococcoidia bacterium]
MESTRDQILRHIRGHREVSVAQLAEALALSSQAVRRHLDGLRADGLIDVRQERHGVGRPALLFFATERGEEMGGRTYLQLLSRMFRHLEKLEAGQVSGASGQQVVEQVFSGIAEEVAADHKAEVRGETLDQRVEEVSRALQREGIVDGWNKEGGAFHLVNGECPYLRLAEMSDAACSADRQSIELLVGADVEQTKRIVDGAPICEYIVRAQPVSLNLEEQK